MTIANVVDSEISGSVDESRTVFGRLLLFERVSTDGASNSENDKLDGNSSSSVGLPAEAWVLGVGGFLELDWNSN